MEKISDTVTSLFHLSFRDKLPALCSGAEVGAIVWADSFGLGWRIGLACSPNEWIVGRVRLYLDHNHSNTEQDCATVSISLRDSTDKDAKALKERIATITDFGHGPPVLLGSWPPADLAAHPYLLLTLVTKARLPQVASDPLASTALAVRQAMTTGEFVDTKFYVFSARRPGSTAGRPRVVYANSSSIGMALPKPTGAKHINGSAPAFLVSMTSDNHIDQDSVLHEYEYELDSDLDDAEENDDDPPVPDPANNRHSSKAHTPKKSDRGSVHEHSSDEYDPPPYSASSCRMILVKGIAHKTWASYIYYRYTGQVSFLPLRSCRGSSKKPQNDPTGPPRCSPKSMYRLASRLGDERMKELAFRAIKEGLSADNIVEEAFSWFTAQYPIISGHEVDRVYELRKKTQVSSALKAELKAVTLGDKPWALGVLVATMEKLNPSEASV